MAATLELIIKGVDHASGTLREVDKSAGGLAKTLGGPLKIGALAGVAALGSAVAIGVSFVRAAAEEEASVKRLAAAVDASGGSWKKSGAAIEDVIQQRQKLAFSDDELRSSLALLVAITGDSDEALKRQTVAMDFARGANISLETASKLLGKVTDENVNVLGRYGIRVKEGADATDLLALVQQKFSGQSAAFAETTAGKWARVNIQFDNIKETIGAALLPTVARLAGTFADFLEEHEDDIQQMSEDFAEFAEKTMPKVEAAAADVAEALALIKDVVVPTVQALNELDNMLGGELSKAFLNSLPVIREWRAAMNIKEAVQEARGDLKGFALDMATSIGPAGDLKNAVEIGGDVLGVFGGKADDAKSSLTDYTLTVQQAQILQGDLMSSGEDLAGVVGNVGAAVQAAGGAIETDLIPGMQDSIATMEDVQTAADETRKRLFDMFKEPTQEEQIAEANLANYRLELSRIEIGLKPLNDAQRTYLDSLGLTGDEAATVELMERGLSRADAERAVQLETQVIPKTKEELDLLRLTRDAAKEQADVKLAQSPKLDEWQRQTNEDVVALEGLQTKLGEFTINDAPSFIGAVDSATGAALRFRDALYDIPAEIKTKLDFDIIRSLIGEGPVGGVGLHAQGGTVRTPFQIVGERGPELAALPIGTRIFPARETAQIIPHINVQTPQAVAATTVRNVTLRVAGPLVQIQGADLDLDNMSMAKYNRFARQIADAVRSELRY